MRVLVTGAAGFIGMHTALRLLERGDEVIGYDNLNAYYDPALKEARLARLKAYPGFTFVRGARDAGRRAPSAVRPSLSPHVHESARAGA